MTKNRICELFAGAMHCCWASHVVGEPQAKAAWRPGSIMDKLNWSRRAAYGVFLLCLTTAIASPAQIFTTLYSFCSEPNCTDGTNPYAGLFQATNGKLYGTTHGGGAHGDYGTVFTITPSGKLTTLHSFVGTDGSSPVAVPVQATNGKLYGTTYRGGASDLGTIFKITQSGKLTTLHSFVGTDGQNPTADLIQASNGKLYGTTRYEGANCCGTVFKITPSGKLTTLYNFADTDGSQPLESLIQATNGNLYGTTNAGGAHKFGTIFKISPSGKLKTLHNFDGADGVFPDAGLVQATNRKLYGTTSGALRDPGARAQGDAGARELGTVFKISLSGKLTTLHRFDGTDGIEPYANLIQGTDRNLYGTTLTGGDHNAGTIFKITPSGKLKTLHNFDGTDGAESYGLIQATDGSLYGTTLTGGEHNLGTVFRLSF